MTQLRIFEEDGAPLAETSDPAEIAEALKPLGVRFERWPTRPLPDAAAILDVYAPEIETLKAEAGFRKRSET